MKKKSKKGKRNQDTLQIFYTISQSFLSFFYFAYSLYVVFDFSENTRKQKKLNFANLIFHYLGPEKTNNSTQLTQTQ